MAPTKDESDSSMRARLVESLSQSFPHSALSRALQLATSEDEDSDDPLSSSCFAELRLEKGVDIMEEEDDDLTSLSWLQDGNLLKELNAGQEENQKENDEMKLEDNVSQMHPPNVPYNPQKHINSKPPYSFSCLIFMAIEDSPVKKLPVKDIYNWILTHFPYFQNAPTGWKNSVRHNLSLNKCFRKVEKEKGQQSIGKGSLWMIDPDYRPNLLQALRKTPYHPYHQLQMLANPQPTANFTILPGTPRPLPLTSRINFNTPSPHLFPFLSRRLAQSKVDLDNNDIDVANTLVSLKSSHNSSMLYNPRLKPLVLPGRDGEDCRSPSPTDAGSDRYRRQIQLRKQKTSNHKRSAPVVCTNSPSEDHTYSVTNSHSRESSSRFSESNSPRSSIDEEYEFGHQGDTEEEEMEHSDSYHSDASDYEYYESDGDDLPRGKRRYNGVLSHAPPSKRRLIEAMDEEEELKLEEGAAALLNLAGITTMNIVPMRSISPSSSNGIKKEIPVSS